MLEPATIAAIVIVVLVDTVEELLVRHVDLSWDVILDRSSDLKHRIGSHSPGGLAPASFPDLWHLVLPVNPFLVLREVSC